MVTVGSSTVSGGSASTVAGSQIVSAMREFLDAVDGDDVAGPAASDSVAFEPWKPSTWLICRAGLAESGRA